MLDADYVVNSDLTMKSVWSQTPIDYTFDAYGAVITNFPFKFMFYSSDTFSWYLRVSEVVIPKYLGGRLLHTIVDEALAQLDHASSVTVESGCQAFSMEDGVLYDLEQTEVVKAFNSTTNFILPPAVRSIHRGAFASCKDLATIAVPRGFPYSELPNEGEISRGQFWSLVGWKHEDGTLVSKEDAATCDQVTLYPHWVKLMDGRAGSYVEIRLPETSLGDDVKWSVKGLPSGMRIAADGGYGFLCGVPTKPGTYHVQLTATSLENKSKKETIDLPVVIGNYYDGGIPVADAYGPFMVGVAASTNLLQATAGCTVTGLPAGLKYDKATGVVSGVPAKAGAATVYFKKGTALASSTFRVAALPAWAQGEFLGRVDNGDGSHGTVSLTVSPAGKISGKVAADGAAGAFAANSYASVDFAGATNLTVEAAGKLGGAPKTLRLVVAGLASGVAPGAACARVEGRLDGAPVALLRNVWKDRAGAPSAAPLAGDYSFRAEDGAPVSLAVDEKGGVKVAATFADGHRLSAATSVLVDEDAFRVQVYGAPDVRNFVPEFFALVRLVPHAGGAEPGVAYRNPGVRIERAGSGGGTVSMNPKYGQGTAGRPVALTAKADPKSVFVGWEYGGGMDYSPAPKLAVGDGDVPVRAVFRLKTDYSEKPVPYLTEENRALFDNLRVGVAFSAALSVDDACRPVRFSAKNLPAGLKLDAATGAVTGVPTKAAEGAMVVVATSEANKALAGLASVPVRVAALDDWAVGAFDGGAESGTATLAIAAGGKISGRYLADGLTWTLSAPSFKSYASGMYRADIVAKTGKLSTTNEVVLTSEGVSCDLFSAFRNGWREEPLRTLAPSFQNRVVQLAEGVVLKIGAAGVATATGTFVTGRDASGRDVVYSATCSAVLVPLDETASRFSVFLYFPPRAGKFAGFAKEAVLDWDGEQFTESRP